MRWSEFEQAAPRLAARGLALIETFHFVFVGTVTRDGGPRVNPVEAYVVDGHLAVNMMWRSLKALDLLRDPRIVVHSAVTSRENHLGEFKLRGRAVAVEDDRLRAAVDETFEREIGWRPPERSHYFTIDVESAAFVAFVDGEQRTTVWTPDRGEVSSTRPG